MRQYLDLMKLVLDQGANRPSRAGDTIGIFGAGLSFEMIGKRFPLVTTRKIHYMPVLGELAAFLKGATQNKTFLEFGCKYWTPNARAWAANVPAAKDDELYLGPVYGAQWRNWNSEGLDQLESLVRKIKQDPHGRRHIITAWNPGELDDMCLPPCHILAQFYVHDDNFLDCMVYMRSVDVCLGLPSDLVLYGALLALVASAVDREAGSLTFTFGDCHIYKNHIEQAVAQLNLEPKPAPRYTMRAGTGLDTFVPEDFEVVGYAPHPAIAYPLNV